MDAYTRKMIVPFVDDLVLCNMKDESFDFDDLDEIDKQKLAALFIEQDNREPDVIVENKSYDKMIGSIIGLLKENNSDTRSNLVNTLQNNIVSYYEKRMREVIKDRVEEIVTYKRQQRNKTVARLSNGDYVEVRI